MGLCLRCVHVCISNCLCMCLTVRLSAAQLLKLKVYEVLAVTSLTLVWPICSVQTDRAVSGGELRFSAPPTPPPHAQIHTLTLYEHTYT